MTTGKFDPMPDPAATPTPITFLTSERRAAPAAAPKNSDMAPPEDDLLLTLISFRVHDVSGEGTALQSQ